MSHPTGGSKGPGGPKGPGPKGPLENSQGSHRTSRGYHTPNKGFIRGRGSQGGCPGGGAGESPGALGCCFRFGVAKAGDVLEAIVADAD